MRIPAPSPSTGQANQKTTKPEPAAQPTTATPSKDIRTKAELIDFE